MSQLAIAATVGRDTEDVFSVFVPIRTHGQNAREHFAVRAKRIAGERRTTRLVLDARSLDCPFRPPLTVTLTRYSSSRMDSDGHVGALKACRDEVASWLQIDDRYDALVRYEYAQSRCARGTFGVRIDVRPRRVV